MFEKDLGEVNDFKVVTKDGNVKWISALGKRIEYQGKIAGVISFRDITERKKAMERFREFFENIPIMGFILDHKGVIEDVNETFCERMGYSEDELVGNSLEDLPGLLSEEDRKKTVERFGKILDGEILPPIQVKYFPREGGTRYAEMKSIRFERVEGPPGVLGFARDITGLVETQEELRESEERFRTFFEGNPDPVFVLDSEGIFKDVNSAFCDFVGYEEGEILGTSFRGADFLPQESVEKTSRGFKRRLEGEEVPPYTIEIETKDGDTRIAEINGSLVRREGEIVGEIGIARDVTEYKEMEKELRRRNESLQAVISISQSLHGSPDFETLAERAAAAMRDFAGSPAIMLLQVDEGGETLGCIAAKGFLEEEVRGPPVLRVEDSLSGEAVKSGEVTVSEDVSSDERVDEQARKVLLNEGFRSGVSIPLRVEGETIGVMNLNFKERYAPTPQEREIFASIGTTLGLALRNAWRMEELEGEIDERRRMERDLRQYKMAVEGSEDLMVAVDEDYTYLFANRAFLKYHQLGEDQVVGQKAPVVLGQDVFDERIKPHVDRCLRGETVHYEMTYEFPERGERRLEIKYYPLKGEDGEVRGVVAVMSDITEEWEREEERRESKEKFKSFFEAHPAPVFVLSRKGIIEEINPAFSELVGYDEDEVVGNYFYEMEFLPEESKEKTRRNFEKRVRGEEVLPYTIKFKTKRGETKHVKINASPLRENGEIVGEVGIAREIKEEIPSGYR